MDREDFSQTPLEDLAQEIAEAHRCLENNAAGGKMVVLP
jgi:hypothetical protein